MMQYGGPYGEMSASLRYLSQRLFTLLLVFFFKYFSVAFFHQHSILDKINTICIILRYQPSDIIEITSTDEEKIKYF